MSQAVSAADVQELKDGVSSLNELLLDQGKRIENITQLLVGNPMDRNPNKGMMGRISIVEEKQEEAEIKVMAKVVEVEKKVMGKVVQIDAKITAIAEERKKNKAYWAGMIAAIVAIFAVVQVVVTYLFSK